jgi:hypothetical protein
MSVGRRTCMAHPAFFYRIMTRSDTEEIAAIFFMDVQCPVFQGKKNKKTVSSVRKRTIPTQRPSFVSEVSANFFFVYRGCHVISMTNPSGRILGFLDRSRYYCFQVAPQLHSRG